MPYFIAPGRFDEALSALARSPGGHDLYDYDEDGTPGQLTVTYVPEHDVFALDFEAEMFPTQDRVIADFTVRRPG